MRQVNVRCIIAACAAGLALCVAVSTIGAQEQPPPVKKQKEQVFIGGEGTKWKMKTTNVATIYTITGTPDKQVVIKHLETTITADTVEYTESKDKKTKTIVATGNVKMVDPQNTITGTKAFADLIARRTIVEGNAKLVTMPKAQADADPESARAKLNEETTLTCDKLDYLYRQKVATAEGNLKITQKARSLTGNKVVYDLVQEKVTLTGGVSVHDENGQSFTSPGVVTASLKKGSEWIEADNGSAALKIDMDDEEAPAEAPKN